MPVGPQAELLLKRGMKSLRKVTSLGKNPRQLGGLQDFERDKTGFPAISQG